MHTLPRFAKSSSLAHVGGQPERLLKLRRDRRIGKNCPVAVVSNARSSKFVAVFSQSRIWYVDGAFGNCSIAANASWRPAAKLDCAAITIKAAKIERPYNRAQRGEPSTSCGRGQSLSACWRLHSSDTVIPTREIDGRATPFREWPQSIPARAPSSKAPAPRCPPNRPCHCRSES
jgi:hypothetical protein